jgi:hypothetical protein
MATIFIQKNKACCALAVPMVQKAQPPRYSPGSDHGSIRVFVTPAALRARSYRRNEGWYGIFSDFRFPKKSKAPLVNRAYA